MLLCLKCLHIEAYYMPRKGDVGTLTGDVQNWAMLIQNYILQVGYVFNQFSNLL